MTHSHKHPKSKFEHFRMDVPKHLIPLAGKTTWRFSLGTTDPNIAAVKRAYWTAHYKGEIIRLNGLHSDQALQDSRDLVGRALDLLALRLGSMDDAIRAHLLLVTHQARHSWGAEHGREADWDLGHPPDEPDNDNQPLESFPGFEGIGERNNFVTRLRLLEQRGVADGIVYQEIAARLLEKEAWRCADLALLGLLSTVGVELRVDTPEHDAAAKELLERLSNHQFGDWEPSIREALRPVVGSDSEHVSLVPSAPAVLPAQSHAAPWANAGIRFDPCQTLSAGLTRWKEAQAPGTSAITETTRAVARFIELYGDRHVASITVNDIFDYRDFIKAMPRGLSLPAIQAAGKTLRQAVEEAHAEEREAKQRALSAGKEATEPKRLSPTSIKKDVGGLSAIFETLASERWILKNPAEKIRIDGYSKSSKKVFPFRPDMMRRLFDSPLFTGCEGARGKKRTRPGPYIFQDTLYWSFLFGATVGHRMSEVAVAPIADVEEAVGPSGEKIVGIFIMEAKNEHSQRVIIVHPELLALGFMDYVEERRRSGNPNLFDLPKGGAKKLSEKLNAYIDAVIVDDRRFVFHSMRHEFADRSEIDVGVELSKKIMGHASGRLYGLGAPLHHAAAELNKIDLSFVDWGRLRTAAGKSTAAAPAA